VPFSDFSIKRALYWAHVEEIDPSRSRWEWAGSTRWVTDLAHFFEALGARGSALIFFGPIRPALTDPLGRRGRPTISSPHVGSPLGCPPPPPICPLSRSSLRPPALPSALVRHVPGRRCLGCLTRHRPSATFRSKPVPLSGRLHSQCSNP
jgi:hypothetical protein